MGSCGGFVSHAKGKTIQETSELSGYYLYWTGIGTLVGIAAGLILYFVFFHVPLRKQAIAIELWVEGQFLRVRQGFLFRSDRRLHFSVIADYTFFDGPLMRWCGIEGISMTTMSRGMAGNIVILGVKDAEKVRDLLSEIDRQREGMTPN